jgi:hypothetical protein
MKFVHADQHVLHVSDGATRPADPSRVFSTRLDRLDELASDVGFSRGVIHELLVPPGFPAPGFFAFLLARAATSEGTRETLSAKSASGAIVWSDPACELYPPALARYGLGLEKLILLRPRKTSDEIMALVECLRCKGVGATVAGLKRLSQVEARRLQLAVERGGGVGIFMRPFGAASTHYAAATRWLVEPARGDEFVQRWSVQLVHGHGGQVGQKVLLELNRDTHLVRASDVARGSDFVREPNVVRASEMLGDRPVVTTKIRTGESTSRAG